MNKNVIIGIIAVLVIIGGIAVFSNRDAVPTTTDTTTTEEMDQRGIETTTTTTTTTETEEPSTSTGVSAGAAVSAGAIKEFTVTGENFKFSPTTMTVNKGDRVKITFVNKQGFHDLVVGGYNARTKQMQAGTQETIEFVADKAGTFEYYCSVGSHRQMGMVGTLTVK
ncbi:MAG: cupredoxin domain-containing protein [bacterium]|nr:cupredoxin domain-containing protein [bacterium]